MNPDGPGAGRGGGRAAALLLAATVLIPIASVLEPAGPEFVVLNRPGSSEAETAGLIAAADGALLRFGPTSSIVVAVSDQPGFALRLYRAGAWLVLSPSMLAGCPSGAR